MWVASVLPTAPGEPAVSYSAVCWLASWQFEGGRTYREYKTVLPKSMRESILSPSSEAKLTTGEKLELIEPVTMDWFFHRANEKMMLHFPDNYSVQQTVHVANETVNEIKYEIVDCRDPEQKHMHCTNKSVLEVWAACDHLGQSTLRSFLDDASSLYLHHLTVALCPLHQPQRNYHRSYLWFLLETLGG